MITNLEILEDPKQLTRGQALIASICEKQIRAFLILVLCTILVYVALVATNTYMHESAHAAINGMYGMSSTFGWEIQGVMIVAYTVPVVPENHTFDELCTDACKALHEQNEIVTYNLEGITSLIIMLFLIFMAYYHARWFDTEEYMKHMQEWSKRKWEKKERKRLEKEYKQQQLELSPG